eukprot:CAMPEP_0175042350 /NCGR_PEP_ID=MMETSP0052_2-20121109/2510_1 /TAXON_ID=51329 ORGANISM="Polytomella parva, Strain SAG 63-3" /NCGR_SAMPLE_ID=MMETSP0052_2 /ASSEMBLY_ACC=CAM_ASM_000194 /LENGTH=301 /DNA_ID=CAMNT_0016305143 /DNA_START=64 /DNA_END=969 /DNA_ORIENTATION=-
MDRFPNEKYVLPFHQHGKGKVRLGRTWREGNVHHFVEWNVFTMIESPMEHAFYTESNEGMTPTDTQKNNVYVVAKRTPQRCSVDEFAVKLAKHFVKTYPLVKKAKVYIEQKPWNRVSVGGQAHDHGYAVTGTEIRTTYVTYDKDDNLEVTAGLKDLQVMKTTQSGYEGYLKCEYTTLPSSNDRIVATSVTSTWKYSSIPQCFESAYQTARTALMETFYGPAKGGVYSPSVQYTMYKMAEEMLNRVPEIGSIFFNLPNLHFNPHRAVGCDKFANDVYVATSEPHGDIECAVSRRDFKSHVSF